MEGDSIFFAIKHAFVETGASLSVNSKEATMLPTNPLKALN